MYKNLVYLSKINHSLSQDAYERLLCFVSPEVRNRCRRFRLREDSLRTLYGELMLRHVLCRHFSFKNDEIEIVKGDNGKPYLKDFPIYFNISHAGNLVVCAFSEHEVGVDVEQIRNIDLAIAKHYFCKSECEDLNAKSIDQRLNYFFSLWTLKESYMKWLGDGMSIPLDSFCFKVDDYGIDVADEHRSIKPFFKQFSIDGYKLSLCSTFDNFHDKVETLIVEEMIF